MTTNNTSAVDTKQLIADSKARFNHNSAKSLLSEKYNSKLLIADQGGLWRADAQTLSLLNNFSSIHLVIIDTFGNPVKVNRRSLLLKLSETYETVMTEWEAEWKTLESTR